MCCIDSLTCKRNCVTIFHMGSLHIEGVDFVGFHLFGKKETPEERLADCQRRRDCAGLARAYYDLGVAAMDKGDLNRAVLWLHRADTVYSAEDEVYDKVGEKIVDDCSERIGALEDAPLLYNDVPAQVEEKAGDLDSAQVRVWGLLSVARLVKLGERLSALHGCEVLGRLGWAADMMLKSFQAPPSQEEYGQLMDVCNQLYELGDSKDFYAGGEIPISGGAPFQVFDLNGMMGVHLELNSYLDSHLRLLSALSQGQEPPSAECGIIGCTLLPDYYVRTGAAGRLEDVPQIKAELERIWSDFAFVSSGPAWTQVAERMDQYRQLDILA